AYEVGRASGFKPAVFNAANETAVYAFLEDKIAFGDIYKVVTSVLESMGPEDDFTLDNLLSIDRWAREKATSLML
ncbi:MAG: 1-deoxy-D-xylulose-5-phosphate reductoisomerase, partial [Veillonella sp.]|nr:1-deoxy-D-xylulose-5-phosphate reductoisomerase [Veillonella sp.]